MPMTAIKQPAKKSYFLLTFMSRNVPAKIYADKSAIPINSRLMIFVVYWPILGPVATK